MKSSLIVAVALLTLPTGTDAAVVRYSFKSGALPLVYSDPELMPEYSDPPEFRRFHFQIEFGRERLPSPLRNSTFDFQSSSFHDPSLTDGDKTERIDGYGDDAEGRSDGFLSDDDESLPFDIVHGGLPFTDVTMTFGDDGQVVNWDLALDNDGDIDYASPDNSRIWVGRQDPGLIYRLDRPGTWTIQGEIAPVPLPPSFAFLLAGLAGLAVARKRQ